MLQVLACEQAFSRLYGRSVARICPQCGFGETAVAILECYLRVCSSARLPVVRGAVVGACRHAAVVGIPLPGGDDKQESTQIAV